MKLQHTFQDSVPQSPPSETYMVGIKGRGQGSFITLSSGQMLMVRWEKYLSTIVPPSSLLPLQPRGLGLCASEGSSVSLASASALELELLVELLGVGLVMSIHESTLSSGLDRGLGVGS